MCNLCVATNPVFPCVGVPGAGDPSQTGSSSSSTAQPPPTSDTWAYGSKTYIPILRAMDTDPTKLCSDVAGDLGLYDIAGTCIPQSYSLNNVNKAQTAALLVDDTLLNNYTDPAKFPLQAVHKVWGDGGGKFNKGVNKKNVYVGASSEGVNFTIGGKAYTKTQQVLYLEAHGDKYSGNVPGLTSGGKQDATCFNPNQKTFYVGQGRTCKAGDVPLPQCPKWTEMSSTIPGYNHRVGGVACTRSQYGPGVYNMLCYVPKTEDTSNGGRGYVFAMWPFHYEEIYKGAQKVDDTKVPCFNECDGMTPVSASCPAAKGCYPTGSTGAPITDDYFSVINHEVDIEIPCNSPQLDWATQMTWDTMNCNTWNSDINYYGVDTGAYYSQVAVKNPNGTFISVQPEASVQKDYHWYTLDWYVNPTDYTKNYVAFYFDDPFDPNKNDPLLPAQPTGKPVFMTNRFVPTRAGRLNFGPWMAWWGYGGNKGFTPQFDTVKVRMAHLSISPYPNSAIDFPQSYDQAGVACDFVDLVTPGTPATKPSNGKFPLWAIIVIVLGTVVLGLVIWAIIDGVKHKKKFIN